MSGWVTCRDMVSNGIIWDGLSTAKCMVRPGLGDTSGKCTVRGHHSGGGSDDGRARRARGLQAGALGYTEAELKKTAWELRNLAQEHLLHIRRPRTCVPI